MTDCKSKFYRCLVRASKDRYPLDIARDVDPDGGGGYILNIFFGWRFDDDLVHTRGYDTLAELRKSANFDVIRCACTSCLEGLQNEA